MSDIYVLWFSVMFNLFTKKSMAWTMVLITSWSNTHTHIAWKDGDYDCLSLSLLGLINTNVKLFSWVQKRNNCANGREKRVLVTDCALFRTHGSELPDSDSMESLHLSLLLNYFTVMWVVLIGNYSSLK